MQEPSASPSAPPAFLVQIVPPARLVRDAAAMETLLQSLNCDEPFVLEIAGDQTKQCFLLRVSSQATLSALCHQLQAHYPQAVLRRAGDPLDLQGGEHALAGYFVLRDQEYFPIRMFGQRELSQEGVDPLVAVLGGMEVAQAGERIVCQLGLVRAPDDWSRAYQRLSVEHPLAQERANARPASQPRSTSSNVNVWFYGLLTVLVGMLVYNWYLAHAWLQLALLVLGVVGSLACWIRWQLRKPPRLYDMQLVGTKLRRSGFYAALRIIAIGGKDTPQARLEELLTGMARAYTQYNLADGNGFILHRTHPIEALAAPNLRHPEDVFVRRSWWQRQITRNVSFVLISAEAALLWHLTQSNAGSPLVERITSRLLLASPDVFARVPSLSSSLPPVELGVSSHRLREIPIALPDTTLLSNHTFIGGGTGRGKTSLIEPIVLGLLQPVRDGSLQPGVVLIDPVGDLYQAVLAGVPRDRIAATYTMDCSDTLHPIGINILDAGLGLSRDTVIDNFIEGFSRLYPSAWGNRMEDALRHALKTLFSLNMRLVQDGKRDQQYTLLDINPLFLVPEYAARLLSELEDEELLLWWRNQFSAIDRDFRLQVIYPVVNKLAQFATNPALAHLLGQPRTTLNVAEVVSDGKIILVNLASAQVGEQVAGIFGSFILNSVHFALQRQNALPREQRRRVAIIVDEFQKVPAGKHEDFMAENRKFGGSLILATQSLKRLDQINPSLRTSTLINVGNLFVFGTGAEDAKILTTELGTTEIDEIDIVNLQPLQCYARVTLSGYILPPFSLQVVPTWAKPHDDDEQARVRAAIQAANLTYHPKTGEDIEADLRAHRRQYAGDLADYLARLRRQVAKMRAWREQQARERAVMEEAAAYDDTLDVPWMLENEQAGFAGTMPGGSGKPRRKQRNKRRERARKYDQAQAQPSGRPDATAARPPGGLAGGKEP